jgi:hypothetical protein
MSNVDYDGIVALLNERFFKAQFFHGLKRGIQSFAYILIGGFPRTSRPSVSPLNEIYSRVAFSIYVHKSEFSFLNFILVVSAKRASISQSAMPTLGFQSNGRRSRPKEYPHVP